MKRMYVVMTAVIFCLAPVRADEPKKLTDAEITKLLIGNWLLEEEGGKNGKLKANTNRKKDGTFDGEGTLENGDRKDKLTISGTWKVSDGFIIDTVTKFNSEVIQPGFVTKDKVLFIDGKTLKFKNERGDEKIRKRIDD
jgi:hypothetical protein